MAVYDATIAAALLRGHLPALSHFPDGRRGPAVTLRRKRQDLLDRQFLAIGPIRAMACAICSMSASVPSKMG